MRVLLDTHLVIWMLREPEQIGREAAELLARYDVERVISAVCLWEISIKRSTGKLSAPLNLPDRLRDLGYEILPVSADHAWVAGGLPRHHLDPFDRLLVAQAMTESLPLVTHDRVLERYGVRVIRA